ncbi:MAG: hypothetical protein MJD61_01165 [Proteobacteria bacterium]|nr:hypothetical protein [Pseudomonadota bacterium]
MTESDRKPKPRPLPRPAGRSAAWPLARPRTATAAAAALPPKSARRGVAWPLAEPLRVNRTPPSHGAGASTEIQEQAATAQSVDEEVVAPSAVSSAESGESETATSAGVATEDRPGQPVDGAGEGLPDPEPPQIRSYARLGRTVPRVRIKDLASKKG